VWNYSKRARCRPLRFERLESRSLMSASVNVVSGILVINSASDLQSGAALCVGDAAAFGLASARPAVAPLTVYETGDAVSANIANEISSRVNPDGTQAGALIPEDGLFQGDTNTLTTANTNVDENGNQTAYNYLYSQAVTTAASGENAWETSYISNNPSDLQGWWNGANTPPPALPPTQDEPALPQAVVNNTNVDYHPFNSATFPVSQTIAANGGSAGVKASSWTSVNPNGGANGSAGTLTYTIGLPPGATVQVTYAFNVTARVSSSPGAPPDTSKASVEVDVQDPNMNGAHVTVEYVQTPAGGFAPPQSEILQPRAFGKTITVVNGNPLAPTNCTITVWPAITNNGGGSAVATILGNVTISGTAGATISVDHP